MKELENIWNGKTFITPEDKENEIYYPDFKKEDFKSGITDSKSGAKVVYVSPSELPSSFKGKVLGIYIPSQHTIYIANNLSEYQRNFVYHHEVAHALGIKDEVQADNYAASRVGYHIRSSSEVYASQKRAS